MVALKSIDCAQARSSVCTLFRLSETLNYFAHACTGTPLLSLTNTVSLCVWLCVLSPPAHTQLDELAQQLDSEVDGLQASRPEPSLRVRFGLLLLSKDDFIKRILKDWDTKGRGEFLKGEFRLNLRNLGLNVRINA